MKEDKYCPSCGRRLSFFYMKPNWPDCGADILRFNAEARLEADARQAAKEVYALRQFLRRADKGILRRTLGARRPMDDHCAGCPHTQWISCGCNP